MTVVGHIGSVLINLVATAVVLAMFSHTNGPFETMVIAGLILIYVSLISATTLLGRAQIESTHASDRQFAKIAHLLNDPQAKEYDEVIKEAALSYKRITTRFYINTSFHLVLGVIAIFNIIRAL